jgi:hypothetical protein
MQYETSLESPSSFVNRPVSQRHWSITTERFKEGLLAPFECALCGIIHLDPIGRNGKQEHLCNACADSFSAPNIFMRTTLQGPIRDLEERETKKGRSWFRLILEIREQGRPGERDERTLIPVNAFSGVADQARELRLGTIVRVDCRISGTEFKAPDGRIKRGVTLTVEALAVIPHEPLVARQERNWHRQAALRPVPRNADGDPTDIGF